MAKLRDFNSISISVASPDEILSWSHGEVKKPETINYRTQKPEKDGLFDERIFGPTKNYECYCGKYKRIRYKGVICEKCGVEVTHSSVRRDRMAHIKLAVPVTHIWFLRSTPSRLGFLLNLPIKTIEQVVYFAAYIITDVNEGLKEETRTKLEEEYKSHKKKIQDEYKLKIKEEGKNSEDLEKELSIKLDELNEQHSTASKELDALQVTKVLSELEYRDMSMKFGHIFTAGIGAEAIREIISQMDLEKNLADLKNEAKQSTGQKHKKIIKRIKLIGNLLKAGIKPEWMVMTVLPVIPPDIRPMVQLDGGRFAASDLNDLYRRVITRNNRLKRLMSIGAPEVICRNEKRMLQEAVDALINNSARQGRTIFNAGNKRTLRSLSDMLKGKQGRFRQNLLGKRVDYSGRSVIVAGPKLLLHQCGLPKIMALELFKPFVIGKLVKEGFAHNIKNAEKLIQNSKKEVWDILEEITKKHFVLLNRAPTLHRLGIQAFQPVLVEGKAIQIHPLVCSAFNADFDGDQMAVHVPLSKAAQEEAKSIIQSSKNLLKPSAGEPVISPTQDMILGCYFLTKLSQGKQGEGLIFANIDEAIQAYRLGHVHLQAPIKARINDEIYETTVGRVIFNSFIPDEIEFLNKDITKKDISNIISESYEKCGGDITAKLADELKRIGFKFATKSGLTIALTDMIVETNKQDVLKESEKEVENITKMYNKGLMTDDERYNLTIKVWSHSKNEISNDLIKTFDEENGMHYLVTSGARGNWGQVTQMCGIKGLVANPAGRTIELPIKSNLKEGFSILEYFIATHGGRKGKSDTALKTAEAGHLTRRLVDAVQDITIKELDCGTEQFHTITVEESEQIGTDFLARIYGRVVANDVANPKTGEIIIEKGSILDKNLISTVSENNVTSIDVRSVVTCNTKNGICQQCYGKDLGTNDTVELGTAVGIIAAQSIGEPGTQLTMRTFHMGGVADGSDITQGLTRVEELFEARTPKEPAILAEIDGTIDIEVSGDKKTIHVTSDEPIVIEYDIPDDYAPAVKVGETVKAKKTIAKGKEHKGSIKTVEEGEVKKVTDNKITVSTKGKLTKSYKVSKKKRLKVSKGDKVVTGQALTSGHLDLRQLMKLAGIYAVQKYLMTEIQSIYASQGQTINDKHIEIIARQMLSKVRITESNDPAYLPGEIKDIIEISTVNEERIKNGEKPIKTERLLLGLTRISLKTSSWLSAASFQETIRVLVEASTTTMVDYLEGLKENVIIGKLIPAGKIYKRRFEKENSESEEEETLTAE